MYESVFKKCKKSIVFLSLCLKEIYRYKNKQNQILRFGSVYFIDNV